MRDLEIDGIGMTSRRTRERLIQRLMDQGIQSGKVLDAIRTIPRHLFLMRRWHIVLMKIQHCRSAIIRRCPSRILWPK